jgi:hypothetical protein
MHIYKLTSLRGDSFFAAAAAIVKFSCQIRKFVMDEGGSFQFLLPLISAMMA